MISGAVPFENIVESVKDETGIANMRPLYDKIRRLIFRAEREIGYGGSIILKRCLYKKDVRGYDGRYIKYPEDMIEFEGVGCPEQGKFTTQCYAVSAEGVRFRDVKKEAVLLYWGLACDGWGNPITTRNHEEAVVAYIIWKLYAPLRFQNKGNNNTFKEYEMSFVSLAMESRGDDAFPTLEEFDQLALLSYSDRRGLIQRPTASYSYCDDGFLPSCCSSSSDGPGPGPEPETIKVHYWQFDNVVDDFGDLLEVIDQEMVDSKPYQELSVFEQGFTVGYTNIGRICFVIQITNSTQWQITDALNNDVTNQFEFTLLLSDALPEAAIFVSKEIYTFSSIFFKFKNLM